MKRKVLLASLPFLVLGSILLAITFVSPPVVTLVSNEQRNIPRSNVPDRYYYAYWSLALSAAQKAEIQFSASQPMSFFILDKENYDRYTRNETFTAFTTSLNELENTHSFTPTRADTYYFFIQNTSSQDATVMVTIRRSFNELAYIGAGIIIFGGILTTLSFVLKPTVVEAPTKVLEIVKMRGRVWISDLASMFSTSQTDIELALMKLRNRGEPILFDVTTGEVSYGPRAPPSEIRPQTAPSVDTGPSENPKELKDLSTEENRKQ